MMLVASAFVFGFGADYKQAVWTNWPLVLTCAGLFFAGSLALLLPENYFTRIFHVASEQFNYLGGCSFGGALHRPPLSPPLLLDSKTLNPKP
jgi:hypothetical protein